MYTDTASHNNEEVDDLDSKDDDAENVDINKDVGYVKENTRVKNEEHIENNDDDDGDDNNDDNDDDSEEKESLEPLIEVETETTKAPDGGWGWIIVLGIMLIRTIVGGFVRSSGLFFVKFSERFGENASNTAWVTSLSSTVRLLVGPFVSVLCNRFSCRKLIYFGAGLYVIGVHISAYADSLEYLYFSYGVLAGLGRSFVLTPLIIILGEYFDKRRSLAFGLASAGFGLGGFAITPSIELLFQQYGFRGTFIFLSGIACHFFVFTSLLRPLSRAKDLTEKLEDEGETMTTRDNNERTEKMDSLISSTGSVHMYSADENSTSINKHQEIPIESTNDQVDNETKVARQTKKKLIDFSVLKDIRFITLCMATFVFTLPSSGLFLPVLAKSRGLSDIQAAYLLSIISGSDIVSRVISGFVLDLKKVRNFRPYVYNLISFIQCISLFSFPSLRSFEQFSAVCVLHGMVMGCKAAQRSVILVDILGAEQLSSSNAFLLAIQGIATLVGPPVSGYLKDTHGKYDYTFYFSGSCVFLGALILASGNLRNHLNKKKE